MKNSTTPLLLGKCQSRYCDDLRRLRRAPPRRFNYPENSVPDLSKACYGCHSYLHNFSWLGENHSWLCPFLLNHYFQYVLLMRKSQRLPAGNKSHFRIRLPGPLNPSVQRKNTIRIVDKFLNAISYTISRQILPVRSGVQSGVI